MIIIMRTPLPHWLPCRLSSTRLAEREITVRLNGKQGTEDTQEHARNTHGTHARQHTPSNQSALYTLHVPRRFRAKVCTIHPARLHPTRLHPTRPHPTRATHLSRGVDAYFAVSFQGAERRWNFT